MKNRWLVISLALTFALMVLFGYQSAWSQTTVSQGSIQGTVTDPSEAAVPGAKITVTNVATGQVVNTSTTSAGTYNSGGLLPGLYTVRVQAPGFKTVELPVTVQVAVTASGNIKLTLGQSSELVEVSSSAMSVNTEQATVMGVLTADQIDKLPIDGRNFLDLASLEPGVQIQDGQTFDPTKAGFTSVSINGVFGRTPRIELDGVDISDETVGTTTQNIGLSSIEEFNISRSFLDISTELTSAGAVNVATRSGTNALHGMAFYNFRDRHAGTASFPGGQIGPYQRNQFGGRVGGPIIRDKLFFFIDAERTKQDELAPLVFTAPFTSLTGGFSSPFRDTVLTGKMDWQAAKDIHVFYRFSYNWNAGAANFGFGYSRFSNRDNTPSHAGGVDITKGSWSHSFRFGYLKFHNLIGDTTAGLGALQNPVPNEEIFFIDNSLVTGPNLLAPQQTFQSNKQLKYDGGKVWGAHVLRFGIGFNRILGGGFAKFLSIAPEAVSAVDPGFGGPVGNPANAGNYPFLEAVFGNGQGFFTEVPSFGAPAGGQQSWRFQWYLGDSWKITPHFTLTYGLRFNRDTGRSDSDLAPIPCSVVDPTVISTLPCTGSAPLFDQWGPGLGNRIRTPGTNFGPQLGFAWDPKKNGKTVIRAGAGIYYENSIFNNTLFDRPAKLPKGLFFADNVLSCFGAGGPGSVSFTLVPGNTITSINGRDLATQVCGQTLAGASPGIGDLQAAYQAAVAAAGLAGNSNFIGNTLEVSVAQQGLAVYDPNYRTPRSYQMNVGIQRELWKGGILTADYIRNVSTRFPLTIDRNHVGDARFLNVNAAKNAIATTNVAFGCGATDINCAIAAGATINDYAGNGLDSGLAFLGGAPFSAIPGLTADTGAAFAGSNPLMGVGDFEEPIGRSVYNALQTSYHQQVNHPLSGISSLNWQISYTLSRFVGNGGNDHNFSAIATDNNNPTFYLGPTSLDRLHQFKFAFTFDVAHRGPRISMLGGYSSAPPSTLTMTLASGQTTGGEIFRTDFTGDGTVGDTFPAFSQPGQFGRSISPAQLGNLIANWNSVQAGTLTPAGLALVGAGLFTQAQLQALGGVKPFVAPPPPGQVGNGSSRNAGFSLSWPIKLRERFSIEPGVSAYNVFNFANFGTLTGTLNNQVTPFAAGSTGQGGFVNGTTAGASREGVRIGPGTGVFSGGAPRQIEWTLRLHF